MNILSLNNITKRFSDKTAVDDVTFEVESGSIFGMLGPNGAGKTTLIRIINNIFGADAGTIVFDGRPLTQTDQSHIGYMPEERGLYKKMKVGEQLFYLARLKGLSSGEASSKIREWLKKFEIEDWWNKKVEELSKGMQQKIQFISTVVHEPKLLILDEPFSGLDPINTNLIKREIYELREKGATVIFSTHRMEQVEEICEHIVLINLGKKVLEGQVADIKQQFKQNKFRIQYDGELPGSVSENYRFAEQNGHGAIIQLEADSDSNEFLRSLINKGVHITGFQELLPTLNEIFIKQVGGSDE